MSSPSQQCTDPGDRDLRTPCYLTLVRTLLDRGLMVSIEVSGRSMRPFLQGGELVTLARVDPFQLRAGDVILYADQFDKPVLHRMVAMQNVAGKLLFHTQGDALGYRDEPISVDRVLGKAVGVRWPGRVREINLQSPACKVLSSTFAWTSRMRSLRARLPLPGLKTGLLDRLSRMQAAALCLGARPPQSDSAAPLTDGPCSPLANS